MLIEVTCAQCQQPHKRERGHVNRSRRIGAPIYCSRTCFGLSHRRMVAVTKAELVERKRLYDMEYRRKNAAELKSSKAAYYRATRDPERERKYRKANMARHVEYCRSPTYKNYKSDYDKTYRGKKYYGDLWESHILLVQLDKYLEPHRYEAAMQNESLGKAQRRKRECQTKFNSLPRI